jgi:carbonic anhydrase
MKYVSCQGDVINNLLEGYRAFHHRYFEEEGGQFFRELVEKGQSPRTMMIACSDSRVDPVTILNCAPGEVFVVRNVANLVPPYENDTKHHGTSAALEFAVCFLQVEYIIVLGHSHCGGIRALLTQDEATSEPSLLSRWMDIAAEAKQKAQASGGAPKIQEQHCCEYSLRASLANLQTFPWIAERVAAGLLQVHAWYFDLETGVLRHFDPESKSFQAF